MSVMTINGGAVAAGASFAVFDPATEVMVGEAPCCSREQLDFAVESAAFAFRSWRRRVEPRRAALKAAAAIIRANQALLAELLVREQGKSLPKAMREVGGTARWFEVTAELDIPQETLHIDGQQRVEVRRKPLGVVAAITPWNYPVMLAGWKIAPALLAGNTVVLKPSPYTPLSTLLLGELLRDVLPAGVLNVIAGDDQLGAWMTAHPGIAKISFTGSVNTGKKVFAAAADDLKRLTLELGGNDAAIVLGDVDVAAVAEKIFWGAFENSGQVCAAIKRVYAHESIYTELVERLAAIAGTVKIGHGLDADVELGPLNNRAQFERVQMLLDDSRCAGGTVVAGGARLGERGYFIAPAIVTGLDNSARLVAEEQFGPALPVLPFSTVEDAIDVANGTRFGLSGSVWSRDSAQAAAIATELDCGTAWVNQHLAVFPQTPCGGAKWSGIGVENGPWGLEGFMQLQTIEVAAG